MFFILYAMQNEDPMHIEVDKFRLPFMTVEERDDYLWRCKVALALKVGELIITLIVLFNIFRLYIFN
jgi:hypothetical protein